MMLTSSCYINIHIVKPLVPCADDDRTEKEEDASLRRQMERQKRGSPLVAEPLFKDRGNEIVDGYIIVGEDDGRVFPQILLEAV